MTLKNGLKMKFITLFFSMFLNFFSCYVYAKPTEGDNAIWDLATAHLLCGAVATVNPKAVTGTSSSYLKESEKLCFLYHTENTANRMCHDYVYGMYKTITSEPAIKYQALRSIRGAHKYLNEALLKTDSTSCEYLQPVTDKFLLENYKLTVH